MTARKMSERARNTRERIISAAVEMSADQTFDALTLREVARAAGIAAPSFYRHFDSMDSLRLAVAKRAGAVLNDLLKEARSAVRNGGNPARASMDVFTDFIATNSNLYQVLMEEWVAGPPANRALLREDIESFVRELAHDLQAGGERTGRPVLDAFALAEALTVMVFAFGATRTGQTQTLSDTLTLAVRTMVVGSECLAARADAG